MMGLLSITSVMKIEDGGGVVFNVIIVNDQIKQCLLGV